MYTGTHRGGLAGATTGPGFVTRIITPGTPNADVVMVGLIPMTVAMAKFGVPGRRHSDNTVRNEAGAVLASAGLVTTSPNSNYNPLALQSNGAPWPVKPSDPRSPQTTGGVAPGEQPRTQPLFVPGILPEEPVYDDSKYGGWGTPIDLNSGRPLEYVAA